MKIVLFALNASYIHTGLAVRALAAPLSRAGFEVVIVERTLKDRRELVLGSLVRCGADVYGFSCYIWNICEMLSFAADIRSLLPECKIILGGPEVSFESADYIHEHPFIDHIIRGEGEAAITRLCIALQGGAPAEPVIDGGSFSGFESAGILYDGVPSGKLLYYESSRGCPYRCSYCLSSLSGSVRAKDADVVLDELLELERPCFGAGIIKFVDRTFNFDRERARKIWRGLRSSRYTKTYHFEICASLLEEADFELLASMPAGRIQLEAGVQSTNPETLRAISREPDAEAVIAKLKRLREAGGIHIHADLIAGLPLETLESFRAAFDRLADACDMLQPGFLKLLKGSPLREEAEKYRIKFMSVPPYTVLETGTLSFDEIMRLHGVEAALERFGNSGGFAHSLDYIMKRSASQFDVFDGLAELCGGDIRRLGQADAFRLLNDYAGGAGLRTAAFVNFLRFDWLSRESARTPSFLNEFMPEYDSEQLAGLKRRHKAELHVFDFGSGIEYHALDRAKKRMYRVL